MHPLCAPRLCFFFLLPLAAAQQLVSSSSDIALLLQKVKPALQGSGAWNAQLATWNASTTPLCLWRGLRWSTPDGRPLRCDSSAATRGNLSLANDLLVLTSIRLPAAALAGRLPPELGAFSALESLYLGANSLSGPIPLELGNAPALSAVDLSGNALSGALPISVWNLCDRVTELRLHGNALAGAIPAPAGPNTSCDRLRVLDLGGNRFSGEFPSFVLAFRGLERLDLGGNRLLSGPIPDALAGIAPRLRALNLSYNNFSGQLPPALGKLMPLESFVGNSPALCGPPLRECVSSRTTGLSSRGVAGILIGVMAGAVVAASLCIGWAQGKWRRSEEEEEDDKQGEGERLVVFEGGEHLTLEEVLNATGQVVAKASYCTVYKAKLASGAGSIELRLLRDGCCCSSNTIEKARRMGRARHENLVALRAFYQGRRGEKLLVYDHFPRATTLHHLLHSSSAEPLLKTWPRRHRIALGAARALAYLHSSSSGDAHGNVRSSNVLVVPADDLSMSRLAEYGLHRLLVPAAAKADGYKAPELHSMRKCSARTDVYAFGILLLELLTGRNPADDDLPSLVKAAVMEETPILEDLLDADLHHLKHRPPNDDDDDLLQALKLAMGCCAPVPTARPTMLEVVRKLEEIRPKNHPRSGLYSPAESRSDAGTPTTAVA